MDIVDATPGRSVKQSMEDPTVANGLMINPAAISFGDSGYAHTILSAIICHQSLPLILQKIADAFVTLCPSKGVAIFTLSGPQFHIEAEAGLPKRLAGAAFPAPAGQRTAASRSTERSTEHSTESEDPHCTFPGLRQILDTGVKLCVAHPLISGSGEARGRFAVFDHQQALLDDTTRAIIQSLCDLARLALEHGQLYEEVVYRTQFDRLTGLPNRILLEDRMRQAMIVARRQGSLLAVCCIDLDRFKQINGTLGHELGDAFFKLISERIDQAIRQNDTLGRHSSDEFILFVSDLTETSEADTICHRLLKDLSAPFLLHGHSLSITASIGISVFPAHGDSPELLLRNADMALQAAKRAGGARAQIYSPALGRQTRRAEEMLGALVDALAQSQFRMAYQPIFNMNKEIAGFEALLRWRHPTWGQISPLEFIPAAEKSGLIVAIGDWVIDEVCRQTMEWSAAAVPPVKMFANVSGVQLERPDFASKIADTLARSGLAPDRLELEITESWIISDLKAAAGKLQDLRDLGIGIAIDDFGTGYASFNYLQELPLDTLKIDRSFVHRLDSSAGNLSTVRAICMLAQQLGLKTVAEGVESEQHVKQLGEIGCELMQGFFLARPLRPDAACLLLSKQQSCSPLPPPARKATTSDLSPKAALIS